MKILLPVAGATPFFPADEFPFPKPLVEMMERPMIAWAIDNLNELEGDPHFVFIAMQDETTQYSLDGVFRLVTGGRCDVVKLPARTAGALCSCLLAIEHIDPEQPLLIANYDQVIEGELPDFIARLRSKDADAGVLTFDATHPRWSYVRTEQGYVVEASEKRVISKEAIAGLYWFARGADFIEAAQNVIRAGDTVNGVYFIASSLNQMILAGKRVASIPMRDQSRLHSFFLPARVHAFEEEMRSRVADASRAALPAKPVHIVIPAAGEGSRFAKAGYGVPKPFIDVLGKPMLTHVLDNVAIRDAQYTLLLREAHLGLSPDAEAEIARRSAHIIPVARLTEGTACTVLLARSAFDDEAPLLVVNSDQLVNFSCQDFVDDARRRGLDGSILVFRDPHRDPKWSFAAIDDAGFVTEVAEKQPISDFATVGIYLFMEGQSFVRAAIDMIANNDRVNGEFYTCPVYNYMIRAGARIGIYEVPFDAMTGLGTPEDMEAYLTLKGGPGTRSADAPVG